MECKYVPLTENNIYDTIIFRSVILGGIMPLSNDRLHDVLLEGLMTKKLSVEEMAEHGAVANGEEMDNGELRFRLMVNGSGYIWTQPPADQLPAWQNSHFHKGVFETYIVQTGQMAMASLHEGKRVVKVYGAGAVVTTELDVPHNLYLYPGSGIHTIKHGVPVGNPERGGADWYPADEDFDAWTKSLDEENIKALAS